MIGQSAHAPEPQAPQPDDARRLRIALVYDDTMDRYGGVAQHCLTLAGYLRRQGHDVSLLVGDTRAKQIESIPVTSLSKNLRVSFNGNVLSVPLRSDRRAIASALQQGFDVVHVQMPYSPLMAGRLIRGVGPQTAVVATFHVASELRRARLGGRLLAAWSRPTTRRIDRVISVSEAAEEFARRAFRLKEFTRVPNMTRVAQMSRGLPTNATPIVAFVGRLEKRKGVKQLLEEFALLVERVPDASLLIAGDGSHGPSLRRMAQTRGVAQKVHFLGAIDNQARALLLASADVACFPSAFGESFGIVLIEAMAAGSGAVIGGDNVGHRAVLGAVSGHAHVIASASRRGEIANRIGALLLDVKLRSQVHDQQQTLVRQFDTEVVCGRVLEVYRQILADRNPLAAGAPTSAGHL